ncbi:MAG: type II secretion system F family protein [Bacillota bacterium]
MVWLIVFLSFLSGVMFIYGGYLILASEKIHIESRLKKIKVERERNREPLDELQRPFMDRIIKPFLNYISNFTKRFTPAKKKTNLERKLLLAGNPGGLNSTEFLSLHYSIAVMVGATGYLLAFFTKSGPAINIVAALMGICFGYILVEMYINLRIKYRQTDITKDLPDVLDLLTVSVEAGLGFDSALQRVVQKTKGPISLEFAKTLQEIKMGKQRREALRDLGLRTGVEDLNTFISALVQADQLGVSIGNVLRIQSEQIRRKRRQRIEEKAMKAPIKMLIPMVLFIFPTIFIVLLGPAALEVLENLGGK